jgi:hypothetical protein
MSAGDFGPPPCHPAGPAPVRPPRSVRRTTSIGVTWRGGFRGEADFLGRARDLFTAADGSSEELAQDWVEVTASPDRTITAIAASRLIDRVQVLLGTNPATTLRATIRAALADEMAAMTPLHLLLDDLTGASLTSSWAWQRVDGNWAETRRAGIPGLGKNGSVVDVCSGFRTGSSALLPDGRPSPAEQSSSPVPSLRNPADPDGWHELTEAPGVSHMRARRMDVTEDVVVRIDIGFQDSAVGPDSTQRYGVHEYRVRATASSSDLILLSLDVSPHLLPYPACPGALPFAQRMIGRPLAEFRRQVGKEIRGADGCTHLSDIMRSMADVPALVAALRAAARR